MEGIGRGRFRISGGADRAGRGRGAGRRRRHCHHAVLGADFSGIETCTKLRSARSWARLTATGERYMKASSILETKIGRAHVRNPVTNAHIVCRLMIEKQK